MFESEKILEDTGWVLDVQIGPGNSILPTKNMKLNYLKGTKSTPTQVSQNAGGMDGRSW